MRKVLMVIVNWGQGKSSEDNDPIMPAETKVIYLDLLSRQREWLLEKNSKNSGFEENVIRKHLYQIDLEEEKLKLM